MSGLRLFYVARIFLRVFRRRQEGAGVVLFRKGQARS